MPDLRIERVEGWQPYDEFLRRRLYHTFQFTNEVGERIKSLRNRINTVQMSIEMGLSREALHVIEEMQQSIKKSEEAQADASLKQGKLNNYVLFLTIVTVAFGVISVGSDFEDAKKAYCNFISWFNS